MPKVVILRGASGSGKSTYTRNNFPNAVVCSADDYFVVNGNYEFDREKLGLAHGDCLKRFTENIQKKTDLIVVDNTNTSATEVAPYAALALAYGYELEVITLLVEPEVAAARNVHGVPLNVVRRQRNNLDFGTKQLMPWWNNKTVVV